MSLLSRMKTAIMSKDRVRLRDRRGAHYPSGTQNCLRDQVWAQRGEPETNPPDYKSKINMMMGNAVEDMMREHMLRRLATLDDHFVGTQIPVGGSNPDWNGYLDALMQLKGEGADWHKYIIEIKAKMGQGGDFLLQFLDPMDSHVIQLGLYLKDAHEKGLTQDGILLYFSLGNQTLGSMVAFYCRYEAPHVILYKAEILEAKLGGKMRLFEKSMSTKIDLQVRALDRMLLVDKHIADGTLPPAEYTYKYEITQDVLRQKSDRGYYKITDAKLIKAIDDGVVLGDWQVKYSPYKNKQLALDGISPEYTDEELSLLKAEYKRRHPASKRWLGAA